MGGKKCPNKALFVGSCVKTRIFNDAGEQRGKHIVTQRQKNLRTKQVEVERRDTAECESDN